MHHAVALLSVWCVGTTALGQLSPHAPFPPGPWKIMAKGETGERQSLTISDGREMKYINFDKVSVFPRLEVGREYRFPEVLTKHPPDQRSYVEKRLTDLVSQTPFRARVEAKTITATTVSLKLACPDGRGLHFRHTGTKGHEDAARLVAPVTRGETYEFPDIVLDRTVEPQKTSATPAQASASTQAADTLGPLRRYVGEWRGVLYTTEGTFITMTCALSADGKGLWREIVFDDSSADPPMLDVAVLTHDSQTGLCQATNPQDASQPPVQTTWKEGALTFTTHLPSRSEGGTRINTATFKGSNVIEWETAETDAGGKNLSSTKGCYQRLIVPPEPAKIASLPPGPKAIPPWQHIPERKVEFLKVRQMPPFRARILQRVITDDEIMVELDLQRLPKSATPLIHPTFGFPLPPFGIHPVHQRRKNCTAAEWALARRLAGRLEVGLTFEFPHVLTENYIPGARPRPTEAMKPLEGFIGEWRPKFDDAELAAKAGHIIMRYSWSSDGTGLWKEVDKYPPEHIRTPRDSLITFDPKQKRYVESTPEPGFSVHVTITKEGKHMVSEPPLAPVSKGEWNTGTQAYSWETRWESGLTEKGSRRLVTPDLIEWTGQRIDKEGTAGPVGSGFYERVKP